MPYLNHLKKLKEERGLSSAEIAEISGIPLPTVQRVLRGETPNPTFETILRITLALGTTPDEIAGIKQTEETPVLAPVATALDNYAELLKEKDERIREKDELIATLKEMSAQDRKQKKRLLWFLALFVGIVAATLATVIIVDALNGGFGYFRY